MIQHKDLIEDLYYNKETGYFYWITPKQGRPTDKPAGTKSHHGYWVITYGGEKILSHRLAFFYMNGEWPNGMVGFKDEDSSNSAWYNLYLKTHEEHFAIIKERHRDKKEKQLMLDSRPVKRATFTNAEAHQAVEEFIKDRILVEGVYVRSQYRKTSTEAGVPLQAPRQD